MNRVPSFKYNITEDELDDIFSKYKEIILKNGFLTNAKYCKEFEAKFSNFIGVPHSLSCNSGTSALELIYRSLDLDNAQVLIPTNTFTATAAPLLNLNGEIKFYDCNSDLAFDLNSIMSTVTERTKAIVVTHIGGFINPEIIELVDFCKSKDIYLIEDCAHAHGSKYKEQRAGSFGIAAAFSFFSTKIMTTGEGGMVTASCEKLINRMRVIADHGQVEDNITMEPGYNFRMSEFHALLGISQLCKIESMLIERNIVANRYNESLKDHPIFTRIQSHPDVFSGLYKYTIMADSKFDVDNLYKRARSKYNIALAGRTYPLPCHKQKVFEKIETGALLNSETLLARQICLPIFPQMEEEEISRVINFLNEYR